MVAGYVCRSGGQLDGGECYFWDAIAESSDDLMKTDEGLLLAGWSPLWLMWSMWLLSSFVMEPHSSEGSCGARRDCHVR